MVVNDVVFSGATYKKEIANHCLNHCLWLPYIYIDTYFHWPNFHLQKSHPKRSQQDCCTARTHVLRTQ